MSPRRRGWPAALVALLVIAPGLRAQDSVSAVVDRLSDERGGALLWQADGQLTPVARAVIATLRGAAERGLDPADYAAGALDSVARGLPVRRLPYGVALDRALTRSVAQYLNDLGRGRVPDLRFEQGELQRPPLALETLVRSAASGVPLETLARAVEPDLAQYRYLLRQLAFYRHLADSTRFAPLPPVRRPVTVGRRYAGAPALRHRLELLGDISPDPAPRDSLLYDAALAEGVKLFQGRHSLAADGVLGPDTRYELNVQPGVRARQIALALERLRWLPALGGQRLVVVNIPGFELFAFDSTGGRGAPALQMRVVLGRAFDKRTPLLLAPMRSVQFRPYWNVPKSILREEILPLLAREPGYLRAERMEVVGPRDTVLGDSVTPVILQRLAAGSLRVRQRPGAWNALGRTKFTFPNLEDVYLHGTPDTAAFRRSRRDLSHGCIRLEHPAALAEWALQGEEGWGRARIDSALVGSDTTTVAIPPGLSLLIFYTTAVATPDGQMLFYRDYYGQDRALLAALRGRREGAPPS